MNSFAVVSVRAKNVVSANSIDSNQTFWRNSRMTANMFRFVSFTSFASQKIFSQKEFKNFEIEAWKDS